MKQLRILLLLGALAFAPVLIVSDLQAQNITTPAATPTVTSPVTSRTITMNGQEVGQVLVGNHIVMTLRAFSGGYTPGQRAGIIASRLSTQLTRGYNWADLRVEKRAGQPVLVMGDSIIATPDAAQAETMNTTPLGLAMAWQHNTQLALQNTQTVATTGTTTTPATTTAVAGSVEYWPDWTNAKTKIVPIISAGTPGLRLGFAQVTGPSDRVDAVKSVVQLDLVFQKSARVRVFVPSSILVGMNRVQGVAVSALLQYGLFKF